MLPKDKDIMKDTRRALREDIGSGDVTADLLPSDKEVVAKIVSREPMLLCGQAWANHTFKALDRKIKIQWLIKEGTWLEVPTTLCTVSGLVRPILSAERTALNFLQTLSGTATKTYHYLQILKGTKTRLLDTRKTLPGLRLAQKYAVACAGGMNHRFGLYDAILIKENHIQACGSLTEAILQARRTHPKLLLEVEVETLTQLKEALNAKPNRILLDNFSVQMLTEAVRMNQPDHCFLESSGGINLENISAYAATGVDYISIGDLTKSVEAIDLSLLIMDK